MKFRYAVLQTTTHPDPKLTGAQFVGEYDLQNSDMECALAEAQAKAQELIGHQWEPFHGGVPVTCVAVRVTLLKEIH